MQKRKHIVGYCPKQNKETSIIVTFVICSALQTDFCEPQSFYCQYNNINDPCINCPIFDDLLC